MQYAVRSAPGAIILELTYAFQLSAPGISSRLGLYCYIDSTFAIESAAASGKVAVVKAAA
jgi:hypothetical protein